ncbi:MAG TPA: tRNA 2-selenouridine(34) synthase MnmH [Ignavibacteria bacterium]|nr:tRNA 2-selenouridine(34) synthase MnmH [Ignavibacteria bacterium]HMR39363.1 tRNA 2-selenouridine(34) synthase MnmH [Ignavibacteria bacterium]
MKFNTSKELFDFIRKTDTSEFPSLKKILENYDSPRVLVNDILSELKIKNKKVLLIDARSEKEFEDSSLPCSLNFPVLNNEERHNTGLVYKKYSQTSAVWLAVQYALPKEDILRSFLKDHDASEKEIFVYCWRGGGRSGYLSKMITDAGYKPKVLTGGYKSFRRKVNEFYSQIKFPYELLELSGMTGCGKTELLKLLSSKLPVLDLEDAAKHFSSLLGHIPYEINNIQPVKNQSAFENNIFSQISLNEFIIDKGTFLIESESKRVGKFQVPKIIYDKLIYSTSVRIISSMESRVKRIVRDYFGNDNRGIEPMIRILKERKSFFRQQLSADVFDQLINLLEKEKVDEFTEIMMKEYYDKKYRVKDKQVIAEVSSDDSDKAVREISEIYREVIKNKKIY